MQLNTLSSSGSRRTQSSEAAVTTTITSEKGWFDVDLLGLWRFRDLVILFVKRDFVALYKQTILGPLWYLIQPLLTTVMFVIIFAKIARLSTEGTPSFLFYLSGIVAWTYFSNCVSKTSDTFGSNAHIFGKVYFPRLVVPTSVAISNLIAFGIQFALLLCLIVYVHLYVAPVVPTWWILALPLVVVQMGVLGVSVGILISAMTTRYRDLNYLVGFGLQLWMYASPIVYPLSQIPEHWRWLFLLNPMTGPLELMRRGLFSIGSAAPEFLVASVGITILVTTAGVVVFTRAEKTFMDTI